MQLSACFDHLADVMSNVKLENLWAETDLQNDCIVLSVALMGLRVLHFRNSHIC